MSAFVYDIPAYLEGASPAEQRAAKVLGKAVHPEALKRLFELWPQAYVQVEHTHRRSEGLELTCTYVYIYRAKPNFASLGALPVFVAGSARCVPGDQWNRRFGVELAFRRALAHVREREART